MTRLPSPRSYAVPWAADNVCVPGCAWVIRGASAATVPSQLEGGAEEGGPTAAFRSFGRRPSVRSLDAILDIEAEAVEEALSVERIAEALQIGWPGSKARRQTYRALAAGLRVALLRKEAPRD